MLTEDVALRLHDLEPDVRAAVLEVAARRRSRWVPSLRLLLSTQGLDTRVEVARFLDIIGDRDDIRPLRRLVRELRLTGADAFLGRGLARRLADRVVIEDLGGPSSESEPSRFQVERYGGRSWLCSSIS